MRVASRTILVTDCHRGSALSAKRFIDHDHVTTNFIRALGLVADNARGLLGRARGNRYRRGQRGSEKEGISRPNWSTR